MEVVGLGVVAEISRFEWAKFGVEKRTIVTAAARMTAVVVR